MEWGILQTHTQTHTHTHTEREREREREREFLPSVVLVSLYNELGCLARTLVTPEIHEREQTLTGKQIPQTRLWAGFELTIMRFAAQCFNQCVIGMPHYPYICKQFHVVFMDSLNNVIIAWLPQNTSLYRFMIIYFCPILVYAWARWARLLINSSVD